ncbi:phenylalanine--tRNA ligase subunit beta [Zongyangia hominis]|uniref:Phenylalanine--tRNA ligase beta subunit n=1 Tax=Zongyangia hominis TaxID=2763677 RepID=A0A926IBE4_9FIRM|nr:phenylalanine--tRNA ligase subunit beta [Zongyangia hominis]MBC8570092.1 phenylalanine--tRNA ligase subunit beta [Zongyangia hominis]
MNLSMRWLSDFVDIDAKPHDFCEAITMSGSKVEGYFIEGSDIDNVIVGKILSIEKHPDADKLVVCQVDVGAGEPIQIVTGATNLVEGDVVPVAMDNSTLPGGKKIRKGKLRGVLSNGMLCSLGELGLTQHDFPNAVEDGIMVLDEENLRLGQDIREAIGLNDTCVEFEITSNRPDCFSIIGLAREAAATYDKPLKLHTPVVKGSGGDIHELLDVEVKNPELCMRYMARMVKNVKIEPSPRWMRERLRACGVRPINNIVDITNYVMLEYGQPMHAFDYKYVNGKKITVRTAQNGEKITTLDDVERGLDESMLVIADEKGPVAVAGVMGGEYSGIMDDTDTIVFESACFNGVSVRLTSKKLALRTESSGRYEKGLDPYNTLPAVERACELVELLGAGEVVDGVIDVDNSDKALRRIPLEPDWINRFLGIEISRERMVQILEKIGCVMEGDDIVIPSFRPDLEHKADISEEIARFYGYDKIPVTAIRGTAQGHLTDLQKFERTVSDTLLAQGLYEIMTYSFISPKYYDKIRLPAESPLRQCVTIQNPLGEDTSVMRTTTLPSMLEILAKNYNNRNESAAFFEISPEYIPTDGPLPDENSQVTLGMYGEAYDFFSLKGVVEELLHVLDIEDYDVEAVSDNPTFHPGRCAKISKDGREIGVLGEVHPLVLQNYGIGVKAYAAKLSAGALFDLRCADKHFTPLPKYPATARDIAVLCDDALPVLTMKKAIQKAAGRILEQVSLFDVYKGKQVPEGKKSVAWSLSFRAADRTLTDEETDRAMKKVLKALDELGATLRA